MDVNAMIELRLVHEIHTSERKSFRACRRRWDWIFRDRNYPIVTAKPLEFGTAYHAAMEAFYDPTFWYGDRVVLANYAISVFVKECEEQRARALKVQGREHLEDEVQKDYDERVELGRGMLQYYFKDVSPKEDINWSPAKVEIEFFVPIPNPETGDEFIWCKCDECWTRWCSYIDLKEAADDGRWIPLNRQPGERELFKGLPVIYAGRIDMIAEDNLGNYWIFDWKTARAVSENFEFLYLDDQVGSYVWALRKLGLNIRGFVYHEQKKAFPQPPKKNQNVRLGRSFSVAQNQDTDYDLYLKTVSTEDTAAWQAGLYDDYLLMLQEIGTRFYYRHQIYKSDAEVEEIERNIGYEALDMIDPGLRIYPSPGRFGCNFCAFQEPCREKNAQQDYQYILNTLFEKKPHYYMREKPSTESKGAE